MEFYEGKEKMVAIANSCNAAFSRGINSSRSEFFVVAFYIRIVLSLNDGQDKNGRLFILWSR